VLDAAFKKFINLLLLLLLPKGVMGA